MPLSGFRCVALLIVNSSLLTVVGALPVTEATASREADEKQAGRTPSADVNAVKSKTEDPKPFSGGEFKPYQSFGFSTRSAADEEKEKVDVDDRGDGEDGRRFRNHLHHRYHDRRRNHCDHHEGGEISTTNKLRSCKVADAVYKHREQIPRRDPCETCVCIDSEVYCFWKPCTFSKSTTASLFTTPAAENFNKSTGAENASEGKTNGSLASKKSENETNEKSNDVLMATNEKFSKMLTNQRKYNILKMMEKTSTAGYSETGGDGTQRTPTTSPITTEPIVCYVMGVMYKYGEVLPKDTGTCLECACSDGGRVTCSPKDCVSQPDLDYLSHNNNMDLFDIDTF